MSRSSSEFVTMRGEMAERVRRHDWAATPLGESEAWPQSLKTAIRIMLSSRYAMWMLWGPELTFFCNDAYLPTVGIKRDWVLGARSDRVWEEIWPDIGPRIGRVLTTGEATWDEGLMLFLERSGFAEETYHTFSYSPLADDAGSINGMLCVVTEVTERIIGERRLRALRDLGVRIGSARSEEGVWSAVQATLAEGSHDLPFTLAYLLDSEGVLRLASTTGVAPGQSIAPATIRLGDEGGWPTASVVNGRAPLTLTDLKTRFATVPTGPWDKPASSAFLAPILGQAQGEPLGVFIIGLNPYRSFDADYRGFADLFNAQLAAGLASAMAYDAERRRAEALAEIDRAKTTFFSNVSHEFRTPLTLMLGPLEELMGAASPLSAQSRALIEIAHRNGLRLQRLVNALLDFSRLEAGRTQARFEPTDLGMVTAEIVSSFRAATDRAGLTLQVDCPTADRAAHIDRQMWEKIVLNLVSNAFKFTFEGGITVTLRSVQDRFRLSVEDTGTGIAPEDLPRLFERFYRVEGARGRSFEGSGIGLALVRELVELHGGTVAAHSTIGEGSCFTVEIPQGTGHLPAAQVESSELGPAAGNRRQAFVEEALHWLPDEVMPELMPAPSERAAAQGAVILLVDDNSDLRRYITRLLTEHGYRVLTAADGEEGLARLHSERPDLVLTDVMMPKLDGFGLLRAIRAAPALRDLPVVLLSARAAEEARVEGLEVGADDYLIKPFAARELLARVAANVTLARMRREVGAALIESEGRFRNMADHAPIMLIVSAADGRSEYFNRAWYTFTGLNEAQSLNGAWLNAVDEADRGTASAVFESAEVRRAEFRLRRADGDWRWIAMQGAPRLDTHGQLVGYISSMSDITEQKEVEAVLRQRIAEAIAARAQVEEALHQAQKMEALGQLTGGIAHDFNNLLTVITGSFGITLRSLEAVGSIPPRAQRALESGLKGAERAAALTHRLLAFSRRQPLSPKPIDVDRLVAGMSDLLHRALGETIELETVSSPSLWRVEVDPNQLESALLNLAVNARDAMPNGGKLTIETANARLDENYAATHVEVAPGQYVVVAVTDTGEGMTRDTLERVFEPFFTTKPVGRGTGLGLSMVYGFTKQSGGHVKIYSEPYQGTTVKIYLPRLLGSQSEELDATPSQPDRSTHEVTILVVEDDADVRAYSCDVLRELGYRVLDAADGPSALRLIDERDEPIALLFSDVVMPGMSGSELAQKARVMLPELKVLFTSGYTRDAIVHGGRLDPGVEMIVKPFTYQALAQKISQVLDAGSSGCILLAGADQPTLKLAAAALRTGGYSVDEARSMSEVLSRLRVSSSGHDAVMLEAGFSDEALRDLVRELRAQRGDVPILIADAGATPETRAWFAEDRRIAFLERPYGATQLGQALMELGVRCRRTPWITGKSS